MTNSSQEHRGYRFGAFTLDLDRGTLLKDGAEVPLRPKSFETLRFLVEHAGKLVSRDEMLTAVWPDVVVTDGSLTQCLIDVRRALGDDDRTMIRTLPRRGLIFEPAVEPVPGTTTDRDAPIAPPRGARPWAWAVLLAALVAIGAWWGITAPPRDEAPAPAPGPLVFDRQPQSIAVLTFEDLGPGGDHGWFAEGLSEEIRNLLGSTPGLKVIGRTSSSAVSADDRDLVAIGRALGARHLLEGTVRDGDGEVRIGVRLVDATDGSVTWTGVYSREVTDVFSLQEEVAAAVLDALEIHIGADPLRSRPTANTEAYALFLQAQLVLNEQDDSPAETYLKKAVELDPGFAEAWELLALAYWAEPDPLRQPEETLELIRESAARALALEPDRNFARALHAEGATDQHSLADAIDAYVATANRQPNNPAVLRPLTWHLTISGYLEEGVRAAERWVAIDPLSSMAHMRHSAALASVERHVEAVAELEAAHRLSGGGTTWYLGESSLWRGEFDAAAQHFENALVEWGHADVAWVRPLLERARDPATDVNVLDREIALIVERMPPLLANFVEPALNRWFLFLGNLDHYFEIVLGRFTGNPRWSHAEHYIWYGTIHRFHGFTGHPRYLEVAERMGLPKVWERRGPPDYCSEIDGRWVCE